MVPLAYPRGSKFHPRVTVNSETDRARCPLGRPTTGGAARRKPLPLTWTTEVGVLSGGGGSRGAGKRRRSRTYRATPARLRAPRRLITPGAMATPQGTGSEQQLWERVAPVSPPPFPLPCIDRLLVAGGCSSACTYVWLSGGNKKTNKKGARSL